MIRRGWGVRGFILGMIFSSAFFWSTSLAQGQTQHSAAALISCPNGGKVLATPTDLQNLGKAENLTGTFCLGNDIDLAGVSWIPIGDPSAPFSGVLDGNGHVISNLTLTSGTMYVGLFGYTSNAQFRNIVILGVSITGTYCGRKFGECRRSCRCK